MSFSFGVTPNYPSGQISESLSFTYADRDSTLNFPGHEGATPFASSHCFAFPPSGIDAPFYVPPRHASKRHPDPKRIPRPRNAFIFFRSWYINNNRGSKEVLQDELSKQAGKVWNNMSEEAKSPFVQLAAAEKEHHYSVYPDYFYSANTKSGGNPTDSQKTKAKKRASCAYDDMSSRTAMGVTPASWYQSGEGFSIEQGPPCPFHTHLDSVPGQFAYQQQARDFMPSYIPTLPNTFDLFNQSPDNISSGIPASSCNPSANSRYPEPPSSLTCDNPYPSADYLALLEHTFSEETLKCEDMMQHCIDEVLAATVLNFSDEYYGQSPAFM